LPPQGRLRAPKGAAVGPTRGRESGTQAVETARRSADLSEAGMRHQQTGEQDCLFYFRRRERLAGRIERFESLLEGAAEIAIADRVERAVLASQADEFL